MLRYYHGLVDFSARSSMRNGSRQKTNESIVWTPRVLSFPFTQCWCKVLVVSGDPFAYESHPPMTPKTQERLHHRNPRDELQDVHQYHLPESREYPWKVCGRVP